MATKRDILLQAGRDLGDTSDAFIQNILAPAFDDVLSELTSEECVAAVRRTETFTIQENVRAYETREICKLTPHYPVEVVKLLVPSWGLPYGQVPKARNVGEYDRIRLQQPTRQGQWRVWFVYPNQRLLLVYPPADATNAGIECEVTFIAPWRSIDLDDDAVDLQQEDISTVVLGLRTHGATFSEMLQQDRMLIETKWQRAKKVMWGRRWVTAGHLSGGDDHTYARR